MLPEKISRSSKCLVLLFFGMSFGALQEASAQVSETRPNASAGTSSARLPAFVESFIGEKNLVAKTVFSTGFENVSDFKGFYIVPQNFRNAASHDLSSEQRVDGRLSHKAWIYQKGKLAANANTNHRAYPTIQMAKTPAGNLRGRALIEFSVWPDINLYKREEESWFSLATFSSYNDEFWYRAYLVNVDQEYRVHLMHVPDQGAASPDIYSSRDTVLPRRAWSRISVYIDYTRNNKFDSPVIAVWQNGTLVSASRFNDRVDPFRIPGNQTPPCLKSWSRSSIEEAEELCKLRYEGGLSQMHFGLYAPPSLSSGVIFNDALVVSEVVKNEE